MTLAQAWEAADPSIPPEVLATLRTSGHQALIDPELLLAIPEYQVSLPGGARPSQTDLFALVRGQGGLAAVAVEGKVDEEFGPRLGAKRMEGAAERIRFLLETLGLPPDTADSIRYQLLHRTVAALILARSFGAQVAVMLVHSFSADHRWFADVEAFVALFGRQVNVGHLAHVANREGTALFVGWAAGDQRFRVDLSSAAV